MNMHDLTIELVGPGKGVLTLDGVKLHATDFSLSAGVNDLTKLTVTLNIHSVNVATGTDVTDLGCDGVRRFAVSTGIEPKR